MTEWWQWVGVSIMRDLVVVNSLRVGEYEWIV